MIFFWFLFCLLFHFSKLTSIAIDDSPKICSSNDKLGRSFYSLCHSDPGTCHLENSTLPICCNCFDVCCDIDEIQNYTLSRVERNANRSLTSAVKSTVGDLGSGVSGAVSGLLDSVSVRVRRSGASKTSRGTGEDIEEENTEDKNKNNSLSNQKELEAIVGTAVRIALNKLAHTLKNVTESEESGSKENITSTTVPPPVESCSSKSKRCEEQEPDLLDEFFPPAKGTRGSRGRKRRDSLRKNPESRISGRSFESSGGLIAKGQIVHEIRTNQNHSLNETEEYMTTEQSLDLTTTELPSTGNATSVNMTTTRQVTNQGSRRSNSQKNQSIEVSSPRPSLVTSSLLVPSIKPGKCDNITTNTQMCIGLQPDAAQCKMDSECEGTWKCCFYGCKPYNKIGICTVPIFF